MKIEFYVIRYNQRLLEIPTITVNQTSHTDGMFDLCVE